MDSMARKQKGGREDKNRWEGQWEEDSERERQMLCRFLGGGSRGETLLHRCQSGIGPS